MLLLLFSLIGFKTNDGIESNLRARGNKNRNFRIISNPNINRAGSCHIESINNLNNAEPLVKSKDVNKNESWYDIQSNSIIIYKNTNRLELEELVAKFPNFSSIIIKKTFISGDKSEKLFNSIENEGFLVLFSKKSK